jgi:hypothetical protein
MRKKFQEIHEDSASLMEISENRVELTGKPHYLATRQAREKTCTATAGNTFSERMTFDIPISTLCVSAATADSHYYTYA